jgi:hypothetical protein
MTYAKVTMIDDLPELDDLERKPEYNQFNENYQQSKGLDMIPNEIADKYKKMIRDPYTPVPESGMMLYNNEHNRGGNYSENYDSFPEDYSRYNHTNSRSNRHNQNNHNVINNDGMIEPLHKEMYLNCIDFANHVKSCPICSKLYNTDKTIYVISIIGLILLCLFLMKRIANI